MTGFATCERKKSASSQSLTFSVYSSHMGATRRMSSVAITTQPPTLDAIFRCSGCRKYWLCASPALLGRERACREALGGGGGRVCGCRAEASMIDVMVVDAEAAWWCSHYTRIHEEGVAGVCQPTRRHARCCPSDDVYGHHLTGARAQWTASLRRVASQQLR